MKSATFYIGERPIGAGHAPFIIAEMSGNHNQSLDRALAIGAGIGSRHEQSGGVIL
jgi:sialic acid synthase SpsE